jgi:hypothetical protein
MKIGTGKATLFSEAWMELYSDMYWQPSQYPLQPRCSISIPHLAEVWKHFICTVMTVRVIVSMVKLLLLCVPNKHNVTFETLSHLGIQWVMTENSEWQTLKKPFKECCIWYNTLCTWAICWDHKKWTKITGKRCTLKLCTEVSLCVCVCR